MSEGEFLVKVGFRRFPFWELALTNFDHGYFFTHLDSFGHIWAIENQAWPQMTHQGASTIDEMAEKGTNLAVVLTRSPDCIWVPF